MNAEIEALAERMYTDRVSSLGLGPTWEQLGDVTRSVWRDYAQADLLSEFA